MTYHPPENYGPPGDDDARWGRAPAQQPPPRKKTGRNVLLTIAGVALLVLLCVAGSALVRGLSGDGKGTIEPKPTATTAAKASSRAAAAKKAPPPAATIGEGTYRVGKDVSAGEYKTAGALDSSVPLCYWHTARDTSNDKIIDQGVTNGASEAGFVRLRDGQYFKTSGCKDWVRQ